MQNYHVIRIIVRDGDLILIGWSIGDDILGIVVSLCAKDGRGSIEGQVGKEGGIINTTATTHIATTSFAIHIVGGIRFPSIIIVVVVVNDQRSSRIDAKMKVRRCCLCGGSSKSATEE